MNYQLLLNCNKVHRAGHGSGLPSDVGMDGSIVVIPLMDDLETEKTDSGASLFMPSQCHHIIQKAVHGPFPCVILLHCDI
jgi:hypothetical protein